MKTNKETLKNEEERKERSRSNYSELPEDDNIPMKVSKKEHGKNKENRESRGLRKSKSQKDRNDPDRFRGDGINFKAKVIGIDNVGDARGNKMCQDALQRLKAAVKSSGEHKQRITLNISLGGIKIKDEKSGDLLHHHPVHKISFISQDTNDNRAFGYVFGCPQTGHQFFAIKTEKTASHVVFTLRDLFHVALELKKKEIEKAMELQKETPEIVEQTSIINGKSKEEQNGSVDQSNNEHSEEACEKPAEPEPVYSDVLIRDNGSQLSDADSIPAAGEPAGVVSVVDNLLDLQFEVDNLQQGITQMEYSIASTASLNFGVSFSEDDNSISSGNSFVTTPRKCDRLSSLYQETLSLSSRSSSTSDYNAYSQEVKNEDLDIAAKSTEVFAGFSLTPPPQNTGAIGNTANIEDKFTVGSANAVENRFTLSNTTIVEDRFTNASANSVEDKFVVSSTNAVEDKFVISSGNAVVDSFPERNAADVDDTSSMGNSETITDENNAVENATVVDDTCAVSSATTVDDRYAVFLDIDSIPSIFDNPKIVALPEYSNETTSTADVSSNKGEFDNSNSLDDCETFGVIKPSGSFLFAELDPLGFQPYVDKKDFFHELKNPPKKVLKDLVGDNSDASNPVFENESTFTVSHINGAIEVSSVTSAVPFNPFITPGDIVPTSPPKLPPKRSMNVSSPIPLSSLELNEPIIYSEEAQSDAINPFNPFFVGDDIPDIPPPSSPPPPPPPPRLPSKSCEPPFTTSPPPPRPPSRTCGTPTPPLPRRKVPLSSANKAWYSFDQDVTCAWSPNTANQEFSVPSSPPLPLPSRKFPMSNKFDSPLQKSSSACSSPASMRKILNSSPLFSNSVSSSEFPEVFHANGVSTSPRKMLTRHSSVTQDPWVENSTKDFGPSISTVKNPFLEPSTSPVPSPSPSPLSSLKDNLIIGQTVARSPPLPPKCISRPRPSPSKKMFSVRSMSQSSSNSSVTESTNESHSTSSLRYRSLEDSRNDSASDMLCRNSTDSQPEAFYTESNSDMKEQNESSEGVCDRAITSLSPTSPDSIFRRKSDPFADDFFLSLPKKVNVSNGSASTSSISEQAQCTNGFNVESKEEEAPTYSQVNKLKKIS